MGMVFMKIIISFLAAGLIGFYYGTKHETKVDLQEELVHMSDSNLYNVYQGMINGRRSVCMELENYEIPESNAHGEAWRK